MAKRSPLPKICHTSPTMMKLSTVTPYLKKIQRIYESRDTPLEFCWHQQFFTGDQQILLHQEIQMWIVFWYIISIYFYFCWVFKYCYKKKVKTLMMSAKVAAPALLKMKVITSYILPMMSTTKLCHMNEILLWMWSCDPSLITVAFVEKELS